MSQPLQPPPHLGYQAQSPKPKKRHTGLKIAGGIVGGLVLIGACSALVSGGDDGKAGEATGTSTVAPAAKTTAPKPAAKTTPPPAKKWVTLTTVKGSGNKASDTITTTGGRVRINYQFSGGDFVIGAVYLMDEGTDFQTDGGLPVVTVSKKAKDSTILRKGAGTYYVQVAAANTSYSVTVQEER